MQRADDREETINNRLEVYRRQTEPLIEYYRGCDLLSVVSAGGSIDQVYGGLVDALAGAAPSGTGP